MVINKINYFLYLPCEISYEILRNLDEKQLLTVSRVSMLFQRLSDSECLWKRFAIMRGLSVKEHQTFKKRVVWYCKESERIASTIKGMRPDEIESFYVKTTELPTFSLDHLQMFLEVDSVLLPINLASVYSRLSDGNGAREEDRKGVGKMLAHVRSSHSNLFWQFLSREYHSYEINWWVSEVGRLRFECQERGQDTSPELERARDELSEATLAGCKEHGRLIFLTGLCLDDLTNEAEVMKELFSGDRSLVLHSFFMKRRYWREAVLFAMQRYASIFADLPIEWKNDPEFVREAVRANGLVLQYLPYKTEADIEDRAAYEELVFSCIQSDSRAIQYVIPSVVDYDALSRLVVLDNPANLVYIRPEYIQNYRSLVTQACEKDPFAISWARSEWLDDNASLVEKALEPPLNHEALETLLDELVTWFSLFSPFSYNEEFVVRARAKLEESRRPCV